MADQVVEHGPDVDGAGRHVRTGDEGEDAVVTGCPQGPGLSADRKAAGYPGAGRPLGLVVGPDHHFAVRATAVPDAVEPDVVGDVVDAGVGAGRGEVGGKGRVVA